MSFTHAAVEVSLRECRSETGDKALAWSARREVAANAAEAVSNREPNMAVADCFQGGGRKERQRQGGWEGVDSEG